MMSSAHWARLSWCCLKWIQNTHAHTHHIHCTLIHLKWIYGKIVNPFNIHSTTIYLYLSYIHETGKHGNDAGVDAAAAAATICVCVDLHTNIKKEGERLDELCVIYSSAPHHKINYTSTILFSPKLKINKLVRCCGRVSFISKQKHAENIQTKK